jgi:hypothetical protein
MTITEMEKYIIDKYNLKPHKLISIKHDNDKPKTACNCWMEIKECYCIKK